MERLESHRSRRFNECFFLCFLSLRSVPYCKISKNIYNRYIMLVLFAFLHVQIQLYFYGVWKGLNVFHMFFGWHWTKDSHWKPIFSSTEQLVGISFVSSRNVILLSISRLLALKMFVQLMIIAFSLSIRFEKCSV